jgi:hypothetical protein
MEGQKMTNGNDPIDPIIGSIGHEDFGGKGVYMNTTGLTKREYFAAMAMQGLCANTAAYNYYDDFKDVAAAALQNADALIEALNKEAK